jgi:solute carrier family 8 (sodium/calcium exchanger)
MFLVALILYQIRVFGRLSTTFEAAMMAASSSLRLVFFLIVLMKSTKDAAIMAASKVVDSRPKTRIWYRINATRNMTGGRKIQPTFKMNDKLKEVYDAINDDVELPNIDYPDSDASKAIVEFHASSAAVLESIGTFKVLISRHGNLQDTVQVK